MENNWVLHNLPKVCVRYYTVHYIVALEYQAVSESQNPDLQCFQENLSNEE